jgi:hypothetical protein
MVKTENYEARDNRVQPFDDKRGYSMAWQPTPIQKTMDWTRIHCTFCSLEADEFRLMLGRWSEGKGGKIWFADVRLEPGGFCNVVRRESCPVTVASQDGKTIYAEGKDLDRIEDPKLGCDPRPGCFTLWHDVPQVTIPRGSRLQDGQKVLVSYNFTTPSGRPGQVNCCLSDPKVYDLIEEQIKYVRDNGRPDIYFMMHDGIRMLGWDDGCAKRNLSCGQILADNIAKCTAIIEKVDPGKPIFVWSDCFDKFNLAKQKQADGRPFIQYLCKGQGPLWGSWEGLPSQVGLVNRSGMNDSYEFFSQLGHQQIISCGSHEKLAEWLKMAGKLDGVVGVMYTTSTGDYGKDIEKLADDAKKWETESGPYGK